MIKRMMTTALVLLAVALPAAAQDKSKELAQELTRLEAENKQLQLRLERLEGLVNQLQAERTDMNHRLTSVGTLLDQVGTMLAGGPVPDELRQQALAMRQPVQPVRPVTPTPRPNTTTNNTTTPRPGTTANNTATARPNTVATNTTAPRPDPLQFTRPINPLLRPHDSTSGTGGGIVAAVDIVKVFNALLATAEADAAFQIAKERFVEDARNRGKSIIDMRYDLGILKVGTPAFIKAKKELEDELQRYQIWRSVQLNAINRQRSDRMEQIYQHAVDTIGRIATENGYDVVVYKESSGDADIDRYQSFNHMALSRKLLFNADEEDLTNLVITRMNAEFSARSASR